MNQASRVASAALTALACALAAIVLAMPVAAQSPTASLAIVATQVPCPSPMAVVPGASPVTASPGVVPTVPSVSEVPCATPGASAVAASGSVTIQDFAFGPASLSVAVGTTVTWTNHGPSGHTVTADDGSFDSGTVQPGSTFSQTFATAGTFSYHCNIHPDMMATVTVQ